MRVAYADPPYPGQAKRHYGKHPDYAGEVDTGTLLGMLDDYDGWCLHTSSSALPAAARSLSEWGFPTGPFGVRIMAWVKPFAAFKAHVPVAYAWEPVLVKACRLPVVKPGLTYRDFISEPITMQRGLVGVKPEAVCRWLFEVMGCEPDDELIDLFPGSGAVTRAWEAWRAQTTIFSEGDAACQRRPVPPSDRFARGAGGTSRESVAASSGAGIPGTDVTDYKKLAEDALDGLTPHAARYTSTRSLAEALLACAEKRDRLAAALEQYVDPTHWGIEREEFDHPRAVWIGPGATEKPYPNPMLVAREALNPGDGE